MPQGTRRNYAVVFITARRLAVHFTHKTSIRMTHKNKWLLFSPLGLATIGAGACMVQWAGHLKDEQLPTSQWVAAGTAALVVLNAGMSLFGRGVLEKMRHELHEKK